MVSGDGERIAPPRCRHGRGLVRPGGVWFGETLPAPALELAETAVAECDLLFSVGTSSRVYPAAALPEIAARRGIPTVQINPEPTPFDGLAAFNLRGAAGAVLPRLLIAPWPMSP
jgi:NAD-dependent deacetylase